VQRMKRMGVVVLLGCQAAATPKVEITAPATATVSAPQTPPPSVATAFAFVGKLAPGVTAQAFRLGASRTWPVGPIQDASMNVVRGSEGDCVIVTASAPPPFTHSATSFARIQGDALASVKVDECHATLATATPRGIWLYDDDKRAIYRAELAANVAMTVVAFPAGLGECTKIVEITSLVALDDNDVWATARCDGDGLGERLLHTEPVGTVDSWPAPP
jgi:hypothetical protein